MARLSDFFYGKTMSILRQSFAAEAHLSVQSGALFK
jgi:hypothetical protein